MEKIDASIEVQLPAERLPGVDRVTSISALEGVGKLESTEDAWDCDD